MVIGRTGDQGGFPEFRGFLTLIIQWEVGRILVGMKSEV